LSLAIIYVAAVGFLPMLDRLVLFPTNGRLDAGGAVRSTVPFEGGELEIWRAKSKRARSEQHVDFFVLRFYGNADRAERWVVADAEMWNGRAVEVWGMNYPGYGGSTGPARLARIGPAALETYDLLRHQAGDRPVVVFGTSLGTTAALHITAHRPAAALIVHNPPALRQMILGQFGWWNLWLLAGPLSMKVPADLDSVANARNSRASALFLIAENDEVVAPRFQEMVAKAYAGEKHLIHLPRSKHNSPITDAVVAQVNGLVEQRLFERRTPLQ
jgi:hypothetical protein